MNYLRLSDPDADAIFLQGREKQNHETTSTELRKDKVPVFLIGSSSLTAKSSIDKCQINEAIMSMEKDNTF